MLAQQNLSEEEIDERSILSTPMVNRINTDLLKFRTLVSHLRLKDKKSSHDYSFHNQSQISNIQPKSDKNSFEMDLNMDKTVKKFVIGSSIPISQQNGDQVLKYKPRSSVNGRDDIRIRNVNQAHKQIIQSLQKARKTTHQYKQEHFQTQKDRFLGSYDEPLKASKFNFRTPRDKMSKAENSRIRHQSQTQKLRNYKQSRIQQKKNIQMGSLNPQQFVTQIEPKILLQYLQKQPNYILNESNPNQIYSFFTYLCNQFGLKNYFEQPLIKRYKNCVYFGQKVPKYGNYLGFVWYYRKAIYYGEFMSGKKNGYGIQIDMENTCNFVWRGTFLNGKKTGYFQLQTPELTYHGTVKNSFFDGEGLLKTKKSTYKGSFLAGMKQGYGLQNFHNKNLNYKGDYLENKFEGKGQLQGSNYYYSGDFRNNKLHGNGFERTDEFEYVGQFRNGKREGNGILKLQDGTIYQGIFENGKITYNYKRERQSREQQTSSIQYIKSIPIQSRARYNKREGNNVKLQKHLSKELYSLYEQNQEGTISQQDIRDRRNPLQLRRILEDDNDEDDPLETKIQYNETS